MRTWHRRPSCALKTTLTSSLVFTAGFDRRSSDFQTRVSRRKAMATSPKASCRPVSDPTSHIEGRTEFSNNFLGPLLLAEGARILLECQLELFRSEAASLMCSRLHFDTWRLQERKEEYHQKKMKDDSNNLIFGSWGRGIEAIFGIFLSCLVSLISLSDELFPVLESYRRAALAFPIVTKSITTGILAGFGDLLAQTVENCFSLCADGEVGVSMVPSSAKYGERRWQCDKLRVASVFLEGVFISGPLMHYSYDFMESVIPIDDMTDSAHRKWFAAAAHVTVDGVFMDPVFIFTLMVITALIQGRASMLLKELKTDYFPAVQVSWLSSTLLTPMQFIAFRYLPLELRVLFMNIQDVLWIAIVSYMAHRLRK